MALRFIDGFDHYVTADLTKKWSATNGTITISSTQARRGGQALSFSSTTALANITLDQQSTWIVGFAFYIGTSVLAGGYLAYLGDAGSDQFGLVLNSDLTVSVRRGTTNVATSVATLATNTWQYLEFKVLINNTTGTYEVRLNGVNILSATGQNTRSTANNSANQIVINGRPSSTNSGMTSSNPSYVDDLYICDASGSANNDFLGDVRVDAYYPSGAGNSTQFTPSAGSNYQCVDEAQLNSDTDYVQSATASQKDTYAFQDMSHTPSNIYGVQINMAAKKDDAGTRTVCAVTRSGGSDTDGTTQALNTSYSILKQIRETDPNTAAAWTKTNFNSAEFGFKVVA